MSDDRPSAIVHVNRELTEADYAEIRSRFEEIPPASPSGSLAELRHRVETLERQMAALQAPG